VFRGYDVEFMTAYDFLIEEMFYRHRLYRFFFQLYVNNRPNTRKELFTIDKVAAPNPKCYVCTEKPEVSNRMSKAKYRQGLLI